MTHCVLLNADYSFLNIVDWKRAMCLVAKNKVQIISYSDKIVRRAEGLMVKVPAVMKLIKLIRAIYRTRVPFSKQNILVRDGFRCAYCGQRSGSLTIDHVLPKSRGGTTSFENCAASCRACNHRKGNQTPREAGMRLCGKLYQPTVSEFMRMKLARLGIDALLAEIGLA